MSFTLFISVLHIDVINAMRILRANKMVKQKRRKYLHEYSIDLTKDYVKRRATVVNFPRKLKRNKRSFEYEQRRCCQCTKH